MYSALYPSVSSVIGELINCPDEDEKTRLDRVYVTKDIIRISNNFGDKKHPDYEFNDKEKKKSARVSSGQGEFAGTHFNSQTTYTIRETDVMLANRLAYIKTLPKEFSNVETERKYFKVKHFNKNVIHIPGIIFEDFSDAYALIEIIIAALKEAYKINDIALKEPLSSTMRNYKSFITLDDANRFDLSIIKDKLNVIKYEQHLFNNYYMNRIEKFLDIKIMKPKNSIDDFKKSKNVLKNENVQNITIKISTNGKIEIDSVSDLAEGNLIYDWIKGFSAIVGIEKITYDYYTTDEEDNNYAIKN